MRRQVQKLVLRLESDQSSDPVPKRRKLNDEPSELLELAARLCRMVDADPSSQVENLESHITFVTCGCQTNITLTYSQRTVS